MNIRQRQIILIGFYLVTVVFLLSSCSKNNNSGFKCLPTLKSFSYPVDQWTIDKPERTILSPTKNGWILQAEEKTLGTPKNLIARGENQLWMLSSSLVRYDKKTKEFKNYKIVLNGVEYLPDTIFLAKNGTLWAVGIQEKTHTSFLSWYNDVEDEFIPVIDLNNALIFDGPVTTGVTEDSNDLLWIAIPGVGLYKFDPQNSVATAITPQDFDVNLINGYVAVDRQGIVWLGTYTNDFWRFLYRYDPKNNSFAKLSLGATGENVESGVFIDSRDRLWIGDYAFWNINQPLPKEGSTGLNLIIRSPAFITQQVPFVDYYWVRPRILFEDKAGNIWYSGAGLVFLNTNSDEWCKVFDGISIATEDKEGVIWAVSNGSIYLHR